MTRRGFLGAITALCVKRPTADARRASAEETPRIVVACGPGAGQVRTVNYISGVHLGVARSFWPHPRPERWDGA